MREQDKNIFFEIDLIKLRQELREFFSSFTFMNNRLAKFFNSIVFIENNN